MSKETTELSASELPDHLIADRGMLIHPCLVDDLAMRYDIIEGITIFKEA